MKNNIEPSSVQQVTESQRKYLLLWSGHPSKWIQIVLHILATMQFPAPKELEHQYVCVPSGNTQEQ